MKRYLLVYIKSLIFTMGMVIIFISFVSAYNLEEYYPLGQGDNWTYSVIEDDESSTETVEIDGKETIDGRETVKMIFSEDNYGCVAIDSEGIKMYKDFDKDGYKIFNPPMMTFPRTEIGEGRNYAINSTTFNIEGTKVGMVNENNKITLESQEDVEVPAGKFTGCFKLASIYDWKEIDGNYGTDDCTIWLALGVGKVKEFCISTEYDSKTKKEETSLERKELIFAVINGKKIGSQ